MHIYLLELKSMILMSFSVYKLTTIVLPLWTIEMISDLVNENI